MNWIKSNKKFDKIQIFSDNSYRYVECEICKYKIKCNLVYQNTLIISFLKTVKFTFLDFKNIPYVVMHLLILYYMVNKCILTFESLISIIFKTYHTNTELVMSFANEFAVLCATVWYAKNALKFYRNIFFEQRNQEIKFINKRNQLNLYE
jgi:hypothetical protein